tara:strand:- start:106 stop:612 length:507 start_codon:yes stop_codon:yes gene_type:complete
MTETEIKILEINVNKVKELLRGRFVRKVLQKNIIYNNPYTKTKGIVVRLRKEGKNTIFTVKSPSKFIRGHKVRKEYETNVENFKLFENMILTMGLRKFSETEAKREYYKLNNCSVEIVKMPKIPTFLEIEGLEKDIIKVARKLGYSKKDYFIGYAPVHYKVGFKKLVF